MIDRELIACFLDEALDTLVQWERACLDLETDPSEEVYHSLFRAAHNLKGASRSVGLEEFGSFVHLVEDVITRIMKNELELSSEILSILLDVQVFLTDWTDQLRTNASYIPNENWIHEKLRILGKPTTPNRAPATTIKIDNDEDDLEALFAQAKAEAERSKVTPQETQQPLSTQPKAQPKQSESAKSESVRPGRTSDETVRVAAHKLDELIQLIGELTIHQSIVFQGRRTGNLQQKFFQNAIMLSNKIIKDLHTTALSLRMQPVQSLFQRLERVAKDIARTQGKNISIVLAGTDVELDKSVIERITDPLVHVIRNAVDHGVENPQARINAGKTPTATITIKAVQDASVVNITVSDDGRGLNTNKVKLKALEKGLIKEGDTLSDKEIQNLIFLPGFSTAEQVTDISGRGVGMDVVMRAVLDLQGTIDVASIEGSGTTFTVTLPTSMSIIDGLVVKVRDLRYVVSMHELTEIIDLSNYPIERSGANGQMISLRGGVIPLEPLRKYIQTSDTSAGEEKTRQGIPALVVRNGSNLIAFEIDDVLGQQSVVVRPLNEQMSSLGGFSGSTVLGDGEPGMILNLSEIARFYFNPTTTQEYHA